MYMGNRILITESNLLSIINKLIMIREDESDDFSQENYSDLDMQDIFIVLFRNWVTQKIGERSKDLPLTYLMKKYGKEFFDEIGETEHRTRGYEFEFSRWELERLLRNAVRRGAIKVPSLRPKGKFTDKFGKAIQFLLERLEIPDYIKMRIEEPTPYNLRIVTVVDYPEFLKTQERKNLTKYSDEFVKSLKDYVGVEEGEPYLGELRIGRTKPIFDNLDNWVKTELKDIKNFIKTIDTGKNVHRIKFEAQEYKGELKLIFKGYASYLIKSEMKQKLNQYLKDSGYKNIQVDY